MKPFLKWAGGKRWLLKSANELLPDIENINTYIEPFLGGGSVYFHLEPQNAILCDINKDLINVYRVVRDDWKSLYAVMRSYHKKHSTEFYYQIRNSNPRVPVQRAGRFIYLNRTCWNGLYRVNKQGQFNVPLGTKSSVIFETDDFESLSALLQFATIEDWDFEVTINKAQDGDFIFVDPPYTVKHNLNGFVKYNEVIFSWQDQIRLRNSLLRAIKKGAKVLITNAAHKSIIELYGSCGKMQSLSRHSIIAGNSSARGLYNELIIKSW